MSVRWPQRWQRLLDHPIATIVVAGLAVRLVVLVLVPPASSNDTGDYVTVAHLIGRLDFTNWNGARTPGFPVVLWAVRYNLRALEVTQQVLGIVGAVLMERTLRRLGESPTTSLIGGLVYALSPVVLLAETNVLTEAVSMFSVVVVLALVSVIDAEVTATGASRVRWYVLLSLDLAWLALTRPSTFVVVIPVTVTLVVILRQRATARSDANPATSVRGRSWVLGVGSVVLVPLLAVGAWSVFNEHTSGYLGPTSLQGFSLSNVTCPFTDQAAPKYRQIANVLVLEEVARRRTTGDCADAVYYATPALQQVTGLRTTPELSRRLTSLSVDLIVHHPRLYARAVAGQWVAQWNYWSFGETDQTNRRLASPVGLVHAGGRILIVTLNLAFLALVLAWLVQRLRHRAVRLPAVVALAAWIAILTSIENPLLEHGALPRQLDPAHPAIILVVVYGVATLLNQTATKRAAEHESGLR